jgi:hypothetical protein
MWHRLRHLAASALLLGAAPLWAANKFQIIGGGVAGSGADKQAFVGTLLYAGAGLAFLLAVLSVVVPHTHAAFLNYANWRQSAIVFALVGVLCLGGGLAVG